MERDRGGREGGGTDEQRHCQEVSEEEKDQGWQAHKKLYIYVYVRDRPNNLTQRGKVTEKSGCSVLFILVI